MLRESILKREESKVEGHERICRSSDFQINEMYQICSPVLFITPSTMLHIVVLLLSSKALSRSIICLRPLFSTHSFQKYNREYLNMLSICCGLVPVYVFGKSYCGWHTDKLERNKKKAKKNGEKQNILVLDSRAVVRKQLQEADSPWGNQLGLFFCLLLESFCCQFGGACGMQFFPLFYFPSLHLKVKSPGM